MFDVMDFLQRHNIPYATSGSNASRGNVNVRCPFCATDTSEHMGISLHGKGWHCWRNPEHSGGYGTLYRLVQALIKCSEQEARMITYSGDRVIPLEEDAITIMKQRLGAAAPEPIKRSRYVRFPADFKPLLSKSRMAQPFFDYMVEDRGIEAGQMPWVCQHYGLHYTTTGRFSYRVIFPVFDRNGKLQSWTGRSIIKGEEKRYYALGRDESLSIVRDNLIGLPMLWRCQNPRVLMVCEGPIDAIRVTVYGRHFGVYGTCMFGLGLSDRQIELLDELRSRFQRISLLLDSAASMQALKLADTGTDLRCSFLPSEFKDPGEMPAQALVDFCLSAAYS